MRKITRTGIVILVAVSMLGLLSVWKVALTDEQEAGNEAVEMEDEAKAKEGREQDEPKVKKEKLSVLSSKKEEEKKEKKEEKKREEEELEGEVVGVEKMTGKIVYFTPRKTPKYVAIAVDKENTDYYFALAKDLRIVNKELLKHLNIGDTVTVTYEQIKTVMKDGTEKAGRKAIIIKFLSPAINGILKSE